VRKPLLVVAVVALLAGNRARADEVDDLVAAAMRQQHIPGLSIAVTRDGKLVRAAGYGLANVEHTVPAKAETIYQSGSVGKQFTAMAVMMLAAEGKLRFDDPITKHLDGAPVSWKDITVRHLLTHTSGIKNYGPRDIDYHRDYTESELIAAAAKLPPDFAPGEGWRYSNTGYMLLGFVIGRASGEFYGDYLKRRVFTPLGMDTARIIDEEAIVPNRAAGYRRVRGELKNQAWVAPFLNTCADGSLYLSVLDLAKWDAALYGDSLLPQSALRAAWVPAKTNDGKEHSYGFGWRLGRVNGRAVVEHGGRWQGFTSHIRRHTDDRFGVIVLCNLAGAEVGELLRAVAGRYVPGPAAGK
jgi:CubicO group peptidase (beta-lactamase class C family)